jgi:hypothetical protein
MVELDFHAIKNELALFWRSVLPKKTELEVAWICQNSLGELPIGDQLNLRMMTSKLSFSTNLEFISVNMNYVAMRISIKHKSELSTYIKWIEIHMGELNKTNSRK